MDVDPKIEVAGNRMKSSITRRALLKSTATLTGGAVAFSVFGLATEAQAAEINRGAAIKPEVTDVKYVTEDNYWLGGY